MNGMANAMNSTPTKTSDQSIDLELMTAVSGWSPRVGPRPIVDLEPRPDGLRVKLTYLGVESGVLFAWGSRVTRPSVHATLDGLFEVLSWRVVTPRG